MYSGIVHAHSGLRWLLLISLLLVLFNAFANRGKIFGEKDRKINLLALILTHVQVLMGIFLFFKSPKVSWAEGFMKNEVTRFFTMEHGLSMVIAAILITIGYSKTKNGGPNALKNTLIFYGIGLILILAMVPWDKVKYGSNWF